MGRTTRQRECTRCGEWFEEPHPWPFDFPRGFCSKACSRKIVSGGSTTTRKPVSVASPEQRAEAASRSCIVCGEPQCDPAHLIDKSLCHDGEGDPRAVVALCREHHRAYDEGGLSILEHLEPYGREALAYAVLRFGLISTLERVTNERWQPTRPLLRAVPTVPGDAA